MLTLFLISHDCLKSAQGLESWRSKGDVCDAALLPHAEVVYVIFNSLLMKTLITPSFVPSSYRYELSLLVRHCFWHMHNESADVLEAGYKQG